MPRSSNNVVLALPIHWPSHVPPFRTVLVRCRRLPNRPFDGLLARCTDRQPGPDLYVPHFVFRPTSGGSTWLSDSPPLPALLSGSPGPPWLAQCEPDPGYGAASMDPSPARLPAEPLARLFGAERDVALGQGGCSADRIWAGAPPAKCCRAMHTLGSLRPKRAADLGRPTCSTCSRSNGESTGCRYGRCSVAWSSSVSVTSLHGACRTGQSTPASS
jgi:hypothetical protein